ncbi:D-alanine--D-alanine ligase [Paenibacillus macerans]|uniref:D-alanine--D-alanine ligase n=1 Tax=Paenibacillus macerans TaxID=44252 RepID=UPI003D316349
MRVGVIMGGTSSEREVSLMTGKEIVGRLDRSKYEVVPIEVARREELIDQVRGIDFALLGLHGTFGEDGTVQGVLETLGIPYSGSGVLSSSLCMDKNLTKRLLRAEGVSTPEWACLDRLSFTGGEWEKTLEPLGYPLFVKPNSGGSSIGVQRVDRKEGLRDALEEAFRWDSEVIVESMVTGQEVTCPVIDGELLPVLGIRATGAEWFDYEAKYSDGGAEELPIALPADVDSRVHSAALGCYRLLKCSVYARIDMILKDGVPYVLEVNTLPGMTANSLLPRSAKAAGISYSELLDRIIELSLAERTGGRAGEAARQVLPMQ